MSLNAEIEADFFSGELDDLFETVSWGTASVQAMVEVVGIESQFDELGGSTYGSAVRSFTFRRTELLAVKSDLSMFGDVITYDSRKYDVNEVDERAGHPAVQVRATLRA